MAEAGGKAVKIVAQLLPKMPRRREKRIIIMARPLAEILTSQSRMLERLGRAGASVSDRQLAATYKKQVETVARVLSERNGLTAITVNYADAIADPLSTAKQVNEFLAADSTPKPWPRSSTNRCIASGCRRRDRRNGCRAGYAP